jgi:hypothetical protein
MFPGVALALALDRGHHLGMKTLLLPVLATCALLTFAGCGDDRDCSKCEKCTSAKAANMSAAAEAEKTFDKEAPADPAAMQAK